MDKMTMINVSEPAYEHFLPVLFDSDLAAK